MPDTDHQGAERLRSEVLAMAARETDAILREAREQGAALEDRAASEALHAREARLAAARAEAAQRCEAIQAAAQMVIVRQEADETEAVLQAIHDEALHQLRQMAVQRRSAALVRLAAAAAGRMAGNRLVLQLSEGDARALGAGLTERLQVAAGPVRPGVDVRLQVDPGQPEGDWVLRDEDGHEAWRLGLAGRLARGWPDLRGEIAQAAGLLEPMQSS